MLMRLRINSRFLIFCLGLILPLGLFLGCSPNSPIKQVGVFSNSSITVSRQIADAIIAACPLTEPGNSNARDACGQKLASSEVLGKAFSKVVLWGGQKELKNYSLKDSELTSLEPHIWRQLYLSTFMFLPNPTIEKVDNLTVIHLPVQFRNQLDPSAYPYPFWHSQKKWQSYQQVTEILLVMEDGKLKGGMRSAQKDLARKVINVDWDGQWNSQVSLFSYLFSKDNPHVQALNTSYRAYENEMRQHSCTICHSPSNQNQMNPLLILNYPNQALTLRHEAVRQIQERLMPPPKGIVDEQLRNRTVELAKAFADLGDKALTYEESKAKVISKK